MASGHLEKRSKTGWTLVIDFGRQKDPKTGKVKQVRRRIALKNVTKAEAQRELVRILSQIHAGTYVPPSAVTLADYLQKWYNERCKPRLAPATLENYRICIDKHIVPALGHIPLDKLQPLHLQETYNRWVEEGKHPRTVQQVHQVLHIALEQAVKWMLVSRNVADAVDPPKPVKREIKAVAPAELQRLIAEAQKSPILELVVLALHTGMRRGELLALRWENIDWENGAIRVEETMQKIDGKIIVKPPKTAKGRRIIPIDDEALAMLHRMREKNPHDLVFCREDGSYLDPSVVTHQFARIAKRAGFNMRFHDLRHTYATIALLAQVPLRVVQELLGHEDMSTTANTYTHVLSTLKKDAARAIGKALSQTREHQMSTKSDSSEGFSGQDLRV